MRLHERVLLHYSDDKSDKVYIMDLMDHEVSSGSSYSLIASWGRRTSPRLSIQVKCEGVPYACAHTEMNKLTRTKVKAGYVPKSLREINIPGYNTGSSNLVYSSTKNRKDNNAVAVDADRAHRGLL